MTNTELRAKKMHEAGWSIGTIHKNLNQQGHQITIHEINVLLNKDYEPNRRSKYNYKVNEKLFTCRTTEELKNRYYLICELLNKGFSKKRTADKLGLSINQIDGPIGRQITKTEIKKRNN